MELEELKASWNVLNERLEKSEVLNKRIIKEMITKRTLTARDRLIKVNLWGALSILIMAILTIIFRGKANIRLEAEIATWLAFAGTFAYLLVSLYILSYFDLEKRTLAELRRWSIKLKRMLRMELLIAPWFGLLIFGVIFFAHHHYRSVQVIIVDLVVILICAALGYLGYKFIDKRSMDEIEKGLEELKEFEEE